MAGDPARPDGELDDWFAESEPARARRAARAASDEAALPGDDDWLAGGESRPRARAGGGLLELVSEWRVVVVLATLVVLLVAGLAIGGVFSSGHPAATVPTEATTASHATTTGPKSTAPAPTNVPTTTLKPGDKGPGVKALQQALKHLGYTVGKVDGVYGTSTQSAVGRFQTASHLTADGVFGPVTLAALVSALRSP